MDLEKKLSLVTGAFGYTGQYIWKELLSRGESVITITRHPEKANQFNEDIGIIPYAFDNPKNLAKSLEGIETVYNTHWIRFEHKDASFDLAVQRNANLIKACEEAGVGKFVHISVSNAQFKQGLPYFDGKNRIEEILQDSNLDFSIIRPALIFGSKEEILVQNIANLLRSFPVFLIPGYGDYIIQPVHVEDVARISVNASRPGSQLINIAGAKDYTFKDFVEIVRSNVGSGSLIIPSPKSLSLAAAKAIGYFYKDVVLTRDEMDALMRGLLESRSPVRGKIDFESWITSNKGIGLKYSHELKRHY